MNCGFRKSDEAAHDVAFQNYSDGEVGVWEMCGYVAGEKSVGTEASILFVRYGRTNEGDAACLANKWCARARETSTEYKGPIQGKEFEWTLLYT